jgi:hypothetical protein
MKRIVNSLCESGRKVIVVTEVLLVMIFSVKELWMEEEEVGIPLLPLCCYQ